MTDINLLDNTVDAFFEYFIEFFVSDDLNDFAKYFALVIDSLSLAYRLKKSEIESYGS